jgi:hypothetical protein
MKILLVLAAIACAIFAFTGVPGLGGEADSPWLGFSDSGGSFDAPAGWLVADPYTRPTGNGKLMWMKDIAPDGCHVAYLRSEDSLMELFLVYGPRVAIEPMLEEAKTRFDDLKAVVKQPVPEMFTHDGMSIEALQRYAPVGVMAGNDMTWYLGWGTSGANMFVVHGGSKQRMFELDTVYNVLSSVSLPND